MVERVFVHVLLVEDNTAEARLLQEFLKGAILNRFDLIHVKRLGDALTQLQMKRFDVVLLDLTLPDSQGLDSLDTLLQQVPRLPIVVLTNTHDDEVAVEAVRRGAQDYLMKRQVNQDSLVRSLRYAIERKQTAEALREVNESLELRVQERTLELATANARLRQEIEHRQQVQERLELAQKAGKIGSFEWNLQSNTVTWGEELEALYGVAPGSFAGRHEVWLATIHSDDRDRIQQELWQVMHQGRALDTEFRVRWRNGEIRWLVAKSNVFHDAEGTPQRLIGVHIDITEKKQLEAQFLRAQRLESLGTLASGIAHDLNNILTPILAVAQLLPMKLPNLSAHTQELLATLSTSAHRGSDLVKQILAFARGIEGNRISLHVSHVLHDVQKMVGQTLPKSIQITTDIPADLWPVFADATQLHQVFTNLCVNARDAMPHGGTLSITAANQQIDEQSARMHLEAEVGIYVAVAIADTGLGIAADVIHQIFDPFFTTKPIGKGTGLGLSAVMGIVKSHGGFIDVQSQVGQGSQFTVYLPASPTATLQKVTTMELLMGQQELVLVVDDERAICEVTKTILEACNYRVLTANDGVEAIALYTEHRHHIWAVLMDLMMPGIDGSTAIHLLHRLNPGVYVVAMSGLHSTETVTQAEKLGFQGFLPKPFTTQEVLQILRNRGNA